MKPRKWAKLGLLSAGALVVPRSVWACAACYGQSDSPMAAGMNWGIATLLAMIIFVLGGVAGFFVFLIRRQSSSTERTEAALTQSWQATWPIVAEKASAFEDEPLPRGGLKGQSILARRRKNCSRKPTSGAPLAGPRGRN